MPRPYKKRADDPEWAALERERDRIKWAQKRARPEWVAARRAKYRDKNAARRRRDGGAWVSWRKMIERCTQPKAAAFPWYGAKGIKVCDRWLPSAGGNYENFFADMGPRPDGMTLDRIDSSGNYEPLNCRWATRATQNANRNWNR